MGRGNLDAELDIEIVGLVPDVTYSEVKDPPPPQFLLAVSTDSRQAERARARMESRARSSAASTCAFDTDGN